jgi:ABC-type transporter Mla subunit MlaD
MYTLPPPDTSGTWVFVSTFFNFVWPYLSIGIALIVLALVVFMILGIFQSMGGGGDDEF